MKKLFGTLPTGEKVYAYTLRGNNISVEIISFGAAVSKFLGFGTDIVTGYDTLDAYYEKGGFQGATIGRVANRIKDARFVIDGVTYNVTKNEGEKCLHGGVGFDRRVFSEVSESDTSVTLSYTSPDGENGFPGNLTLTVKFTVTGDALAIEYKATADKKTPINLTNHAFFNLDGLGKDIKKHKMKMYANRYLELDSENLSTGRILPTKNTRYDFSTLRTVCDTLMEEGVEYDRHFIIEPEKYGEFLGKRLPLAVELEGEALRLSMFTDREGFQFYSGGAVEGFLTQKGGFTPKRYGALCLEAQDEPGTVNFGRGFYDAGEEYTQFTVYKLERK